MNRLLAALIGISVAFAPASVTAQPTNEGVTVAVEPDAKDVTLGDHLDLSVTVTNTGAQPAADLVAHIDITDPSRSSSVDPEDWTGTLSKPVGPLDPGQSADVTWRIQPISPGTFTLYAVALAPGADTIAASNVLHITVDDQRSLNPNGILPVAIAAPTLIGGLLAIQQNTSRRGRNPDTTVDAAGRRSAHT